MFTTSNTIEDYFGQLLTQMSTQVVIRSTLRNKRLLVTVRR